MVGYVTAVTSAALSQGSDAVTRPWVVCSLLTNACGTSRHAADLSYPSSGARMVTGSAALATSTSVLSDAVLVERIAALGDRTALAELDARHGMTLYALAYSLLFDPAEADAAVAVAFREAWRGGAFLRPPRESGPEGGAPPPPPPAPPGTRFP